MQTNEQDTIRYIDTDKNQDKVLKESFSLYKGGSLEFLDEELNGEITDILSPEKTETTTSKSYSDKILKLSNNTGLHIEWESDINTDDLMRFCSYNIDMSRMHKIPFKTVILTTKMPKDTAYKNLSVSFTPKVINLRERIAEDKLAEIEQKISAGQQSQINMLELIYLPLYKSTTGKSIADLLDTAIKLTSKVVADDHRKQEKLYDLLILLTASFVTEQELNTILEENMRLLENHPAVRVLEDRGFKNGMRKGLDQGLNQGLSQGLNQGLNHAKVEIARNMLQAGEDYSRISLFTGLATDRIAELDAERQGRGA